MSEQNVGIIKQVMVPVVDVEFASGNLPALYNALRVKKKSMGREERKLVLEVATHLGRNVGKTMAM